MKPFTHRLVAVLLATTAALPAYVLAASDGSCERKIAALKTTRDRKVASCEKRAARNDSYDLSGCIAAADRAYEKSLARLECDNAPPPPQPPPRNPPAGSFTKRIVVPATGVYTDTGLSLWSGCPVEVDAKGSWSYSGTPNLGAGGDRIYPGTIVPNEKIGALIGLLRGTEASRPIAGNTKSASFPIGNRSGFVAAGPVMGRLYLAMNDVAGTYGDNQGALTVDLTMPGYCVEAAVRVAANQESSDSGLTLAPGQALQITATGSWTYAAGGPGLGVSGQANSANAQFIVPSANLGELVGLTGSRRFALGTLTGVSAEGGSLRLTMNDLPGSYRDNSGALDVLITAQHYCRPVAVNGAVRCIASRPNGGVYLYLNPGDPEFSALPAKDTFTQANEPDKNYCGATAGKNFLRWYGIEESYEDMAAAMHTNSWDRGAALGTAAAVCGLEAFCTFALYSFADAVVKGGTLPRDMRDALYARRPPGYHACGSERRPYSLDEIRASLLAGNPIVFLESQGTRQLHWAVIVGLEMGSGTPILKFANTGSRSYAQFITDWSLSRAGGGKVMENDLLGIGAVPYVAVRWCGQEVPRAKSTTTAANADGHLEVFYTDDDDVLHHKWQLSPGGAWSEDSLLGAPTDQAKQFVAVRNADGRLEVIYIGMDDVLYHTWQVAPNAGWSGEHRLGAASDQAKQIVAAPNADGRLEVIFIGMDDSLWHTWQLSRGGAWIGARLLGAASDQAKQIVAVPNADGRLEVIFIGMDDVLWHTWQLSPGGAWIGARVLAGASDQAKQIVAVPNADGRLEVIFIGMDDVLWHTWQLSRGGAWIGARLLAGATDQAKQIVAVPNSDGRIEVILIGMDDALWHTWQVTAGGAWTGARLLGTGTDQARQISAARNADGRLEVIDVGFEGTLLHTWQASPGGGWVGTQPLM